MSKIYFICGFVGSGKTTFAKKLATEKAAFRFSIDEWMIPLYGEHMERGLFNKRLGILQHLFKASALQMLNLNTPVIFDFGFWTKADRASIINWADENSLDYELIYLDVSFEDCCQRVKKRNLEQDPTSYEMTPEMLNLFWSWFEVPDNECTKVVDF
jgi:predicted kinase